MIHLLVYCPVIAQLTLVPVPFPFPFPFRIELSTLGPLAGHLQIQSLRHRLSVAGAPNDGLISLRSFETLF